MEFPIFHLDFLGNRFLIALIAIVHVVINHGLAVGFVPIVTFLQYLGYKKKSDKIDDVAYKLLFTAFIITTTVGALTGVGIWFSTSLVNPAAIGSLIRVFYWAWFFEWLIFITEVCLILAYFLSWKKAKLDPIKRKRHMILGVFLGIFSWITMAVIVSILGFMMDPGNWLNESNFLNGIFNPIYFPQLLFRTNLAFFKGLVIAMFLICIYTRKDKELRGQLLKILASFLLVFCVLTIFSGYWYWSVVPGYMADNIAVGLMTMKFSNWLSEFMRFGIGTIIAMFIVAQITSVRPLLVPKFIYIIMLIATISLTGYFERAREFLRKPYVIGGYMYANGLLEKDYDKLQKEGLINNMSYLHNLSDKELLIVKNKKDIEDYELGKSVFLISCSKCHTGAGINNVVDKFTGLFGEGEWDEEILIDYIKTMHLAQPYMPPFPGNEKDMSYLVRYLSFIKSNDLKVTGAQTSGVKINPYSRKETVK